MHINKNMHGKYINVSRYLNTSFVFDISDLEYGKFITLFKTSLFLNMYMYSEECIL